MAILGGAAGSGPVDVNGDRGTMVRNPEYNFCDVEWGPDEARGDVRLPSYFVRIPEFQSLVDGGHRYIIGRKGTGKTAVLERIRLMVDSDPLAFHASLSLRNFPVQAMRSLRDTGYRDKSQFVPIWTFLFVIELARLILQDNSVAGDEATGELRDFLERNHLLRESGIAETVTHLTGVKSKVTVLPKWLGGEIADEQQDTFAVPIHYQKSTELLLQRIESVPTECTYYLMIDELDEGYAAGDAGIRLLLLALLRAAEDTAIRLQSSGIRFRPIVALRSDIFDGLEDNDLNKLDDSVARILWQGALHGKYSLRKIVDARIRASLEMPSAVNPWELVVDDDDDEKPRSVKSLWSYIATRTFERPRDLVKYLKLCRTHVGSSGKLSYHAVSEAEREFSGWLYRELSDEIHSHLPVWKEALQCLTRIGVGIFSSDRLVSEIEQDQGIARWMKDHGKTTDDVLEALFDFGVIGNLSDQNRWLFHYKDTDLVLNPQMRIIVHFGFHKKLRLRAGT